jgi:hypothetical protein
LYYYQVTNLEGDNAEYRSSNNWRARLNATIKFSMTSRLQISGDFNSASATATGTEKSNYSVDAAYRQEFFGRKLSLSFRISDIFDTRGEKTTTYGSNYTIVSDNKRRPRSFMLSLSYKINNYKVKDLKGADPASGGGGGMDMF